MSYGKITVGYGTREQKELELRDYLRASFLDNRLISISTIEDGSIVAVVESPPSTGRASQSSIWLSKESFIGIIGTAFLYFSAKNEDLGKLIKEVTINNDIQYNFSENLNIPFTETICNEKQNEETINVSVNSFIDRFKGAYPDVEGRTHWKTWGELKADMEAHILALINKPKIYAITTKEGVCEIFYSKQHAEEKIETQYKKDFPDKEFWVEEFGVK